MFPESASEIWAVSGFGFAVRSAKVDMMKPRVQIPHWKPPSSQYARWIGWSPATPGPVARLATVLIC